jgi:CRP-like cAMP-binding protein
MYPPFVLFVLNVLFVRAEISKYMILSSLDGKRSAKLTQVTPSGDQVILQIVGPGGGIGIIVALGQMDYPVSAEALEDCLAYAWDRQTTRELMLQIPLVACCLRVGRFLQMGKRRARK